LTDLDSNTEWKKWGKEDPLWGVASWANKQRGGAAPWTVEEFYAVGESDWEDFERQWLQYGMDRRSCLEVGCGAGRITKHLTRSFERVYAVDVSEHMIDSARQAVGGCNVEFSVTDGLHLPQGDCTVRAIFSTHVLQHLDSADIGFAYFREFFRVLDVGGTIMIHLPFYQFPGDIRRVEILVRLLYSAFRRLAGMRAKISRRAGARIMRETPYPVRDLTNFLRHLGFRNIEFRTFAVKVNGDFHSFVLASK
jgi:ubiquinone/menaquinone biosynthesis C-methylase UbiE